MDWVTLGSQLGLPVALLLSVLLVWYLDRDGGAVTARLRKRLLLGVPFGTVTTILLVVLVYLFVQQGFWHPYTPLTIPFTSWSYLYPLGMLVAPFAHQSLGHLTGNLIGFAVFGPIAEYAFSHFPSRRGTHSFGSARTNPYVRAFVLFPGGVILAGIVTSIFAWGPIIGFSGVLFAAVGFGLVRFPMVTVIGLVGREFVGTLYYSLRDPVVFQSAGPSFGPPWWAGIAIQGHLLGFLTGVLLGVLLVQRRPASERPSASRLWLGTVIAGSSLTLWAVWWFRGGSSYVLYRGPGLIMVLVLGVLIASAVRASESPLIEGVSRRQVAVAVLVLPLLTMGFVAVPLNLMTVSDAMVPGEPVTVEDYQVTYAEDVPNQRIGAINVSFLGESTTVNASGVIVVNQDRQVWNEEVSAGRLANQGGATVTVGGVGWRETVDIRRDGWQVSGGGTAYIISVRPGDESYTPVFESETVRAAPIIAGRNISVVPADGRFLLSVRASNTSSVIEPARPVRRPIPPANQTVEVGGLTFTREQDVVYASRNETRVPVLQIETYQ